MESESNNSGGTKRKPEGPPSIAPPAQKKVVVKTISSAPVLYNSANQTKNDAQSTAPYYVSPLFTEKDRMDARQGQSYQDVLKQLEGGKQSTPQYVFPQNAPKKVDKGTYNPRYFRKGAGEQWEDLSLADWDPKDFRLFVGDLGNDVSDELLCRTFMRYPSFVRAKVIRDKRTGKTRGFGFVSFSESDDFLKAFSEMNGKYIGNRPCKLKKSKWEDRLDVERMEKDKNWQLSQTGKK